MGGWGGIEPPCLLGAAGLQSAGFSQFAHTARVLTDHNVNASLLFDDMNATESLVVRQLCDEPTVLATLHPLADVERRPTFVTRRPRPRRRSSVPVSSSELSLNVLRSHGAIDGEVSPGRPVKPTIEFKHKSGCGRTNISSPFR